MIAVRTFELRDAPTLADVWEQAYIDDGHLPESARASIRDISRFRTERVLVACADGAVVGGIVLVMAPSPWGRVAREGEAELRALGVARAGRGRGAARALVEAAIEAARTEGAAAVALWTRPQMTVARDLYASVGFERAPERDFDRDGKRMLSFLLPLPHRPR